MFAEPLKETPPIFRDVVNVAAEPVVFWFNVATLAAAIVPELIFEPFNAVKFAPLTAGSVEGNLASGTVPEVKLLALKFARSTVSQVGFALEPLVLKNLPEVPAFKSDGVPDAP